MSVRDIDIYAAGAALGIYYGVFLGGKLHDRDFLSRRISLRALLIVTTLVAVLLGLGVWLAS